MDTALLNSLLEGAIGSTVGLVGAVLAAYLLIRHERGIRRSDSAQHRTSQEDAERKEAAARVSIASGSLVKELIRPQIFVGRARVELMEALAHFSAITYGTHRPVAEWANVTAQEAIHLAGKATRGWLLPGSLRRRQEAASRLGELMATLPAWAQGNIEDHWFDEKLQALKASNSGSA